MVKHSMKSEVETVQVVLFDADGVIQCPQKPIREALADLVPHHDDPALFEEAVFSAERPYLNGGNGFESALKDVLEVHGSKATLEFS